MTPTCGIVAVHEVLANERGHASHRGRRHAGARQRRHLAAVHLPIVAIAIA